MSTEHLFIFINILLLCSYIAATCCGMSSCAGGYSIRTNQKWDSELSQHIAHDDVKSRRNIPFDYIDRNEHTKDWTKVELDGFFGGAQKRERSMAAEQFERIFTLQSPILFFVTWKVHWKLASNENKLVFEMRILAKTQWTNFMLQFCSRANFFMFIKM